MTEDYLAGWRAAREQYQSTGGVQPFPPGYKPKEEPKPFKPPVKPKGEMMWPA